MKELCRDLVGKKVRLLIDVETIGGVKFKAGEVLVVLSTHRGRFELFRDSDTTSVSRINRRELQRVDA